MKEYLEFLSEEQTRKYLQDIKEIRNKVVLAYDLQIVDSINPDIHDIAFDYIITNTRLEKIIKNS